MYKLIHCPGVDSQYKQLNESQGQLEGQLDFLKIQQINGDHILDDAENLYERWPALDLAVKRRIVEDLTQSIVIDKEDITIKFGYNPIILPILFVNPPKAQHNFSASFRCGTLRSCAG